MVMDTALLSGPNTNVGVYSIVPIRFTVKRCGSKAVCKH